MPRVLNAIFAWIATGIGALEILSWLPSTALVALAVFITAIVTWFLLHKFGIPRRAIERSVERQRRECGY